MTRRWPRESWFLLLAGALVLLVTARALAQASAPLRTAKFAWDKNNVALRGTFAFKDALEDKVIARKMANGMKTTLFMRAYVYANSGGNPIGWTAHTCNIGYDLWNEVYNVAVNNGKVQVVVNAKGVHRLCTEMADKELVQRSALSGSASGYYLYVKVEVNPVSPQTLQRIQQWVTRPAGASTTISPGDALFASFVGVFMKNLPNADKEVEFKTASFPP